MNCDKFLVWLTMVLEYASDRWPGAHFVVHMDNASYHNARERPVNLDTAPVMDIIMYIVNNSPADMGLTVDHFLKENGDPLSRTRLKELYRNLLPPHPMRILHVVQQFNAEVRFTPQYWPETQPVELWNQNLKFDYKDRNHDERGPDVGRAIRQFCNAVDNDNPERHAQGWVEKTDQFCRAVCEEDAEVLTPLVLELLQ